MGSTTVGVTTWIKSTVLKGIPFTRTGCTGMGNPTRGALLGRKVDKGFKTLCKTGAMPRGCPHWTLKRLAAIEKTLKQAGVTLVDANTFVKFNRLKTHIDGVGKMKNGSLVVIELKCTQATLANHRKAYDVACSLQPQVLLGKDVLPNTERIHHQIQVRFGMVALKNAVHGLVVVSASDGAVAYRATSGIPSTVFSNAEPVNVKAEKTARPRAGKASKSKRAVKGYKWPGANIALRGEEWMDSARVTLCVALVQHSSSGKFGLATATFPGHANFLAAKKRLNASRHLVDDEVSKSMIVVPSKGMWRCHYV